MIGGVDVVIPCAPKDEIKLPFVLDSIERCLTGIEAVHIITPNGIERETRRVWPMFYHNDDEVLTFDWSRIKYRPTWVKQQMLKLFQNVTASEWYLVMDADRLLNQPQELFDGLKPVLFLSSRDQNFDFYFEYTRKMLGVDRTYPHSFLSECTLYNRSLIGWMLEEAGLTVDGWLAKTADITDCSCMPGDAEIYGHWLAARHPDMYECRILKDEIRGKFADMGEWTAEEMQLYVEEMRPRADIQMFSAHSWHD